MQIDYNATPAGEPYLATCWPVDSVLRDRYDEAQEESIESELALKHSPSVHTQQQSNCKNSSEKQHTGKRTKPAVRSQTSTQASAADWAIKPKGVCRSVKDVLALFELGKREGKEYSFSIPGFFKYEHLRKKYCLGAELIRQGSDSTNISVRKIMSHSLRWYLHCGDGNLSLPQIRQQDSVFEALVAIHKRDEAFGRMPESDQRIVIDDCRQKAFYKKPKAPTDQQSANRKSKQGSQQRIETAWFESVARTGLATSFNELTALSGASKRGVTKFLNERILEVCRRLSQEIGRLPSEETLAAAGPFTPEHAHKFLSKFTGGTTVSRQITNTSSISSRTDLNRYSNLLQGGGTSNELGTLHQNEGRSSSQDKLTVWQQALEMVLESFAAPDFGRSRRDPWCCLSNEVQATVLRYGSRTSFLNYLKPFLQDLRDGLSPSERERRRQLVSERESVWEEALADVSKAAANRELFLALPSDEQQWINSNHLSIEYSNWCIERRTSNGISQQIKISSLTPPPTKLCRGCGEQVMFLRTRNGRNTPIQLQADVAHCDIFDPNKHQCHLNTCQALRHSML